MERPLEKEYNMKTRFVDKSFLKDNDLYISKLEAELKEVKKLNEQLHGGQKLLLERIDDLHTNEDYKKLEEAIEALLILIDPRILIDGEIIGKGKSIIWKRVVKTAQDLIKEK